jgi:hypothetical protein
MEGTTNPLALSLSKGESSHSRSWFDKLTTSGLERVRSSCLPASGGSLSKGERKKEPPGETYRLSW